MSSITITENKTENLVTADKNRNIGSERNEYHNTNNMKTSTACPYDVMLDKDDPPFLAPVRKWEKQVGFVTPIRWTNFIAISLLNIITVCFALRTTICQSMSFKTFIFSVYLGFSAGFGVTGGAHRLWSHRSYKATTPAKIILLMCYSVAGQYSILQWVRDHRVHHKYSETAADPHDANRGFFFSHMGWLMMRKHPEVVAAGNKLDMSDITSDPLLRFYNRHFAVFKLLFCFILPIVIPIYCWNEDLGTATIACFWRYVASLHCTWSVNSFAHLWGNKPYDRNIMPSENWGVSVAAFGEGWHNYHHTFPWDYKAAELPYSLNMTTVIIDIFAALGWVHSRKMASQDMIQSVSNSKGDPTFHKQA